MRLARDGNGRDLKRRDWTGTTCVWRCEVTRLHGALSSPPPWGFPLASCGATRCNADTLHSGQTGTGCGQSSAGHKVWSLLQDRAHSEGSSFLSRSLQPGRFLPGTHRNCFECPSQGISCFLGARLLPVLALQRRSNNSTRIHLSANPWPAALRTRAPAPGLQKLCEWL